MSATRLLLANAFGVRHERRHRDVAHDNRGCKDSYATDVGGNPTPLLRPTQAIRPWSACLDGFSRYPLTETASRPVRVDRIARRESPPRTRTCYVPEWHARRPRRSDGGRGTGRAPRLRRTAYRGSDGKLTDKVRHIKTTIRHVRELYGTALAVTFGPMALKAVRLGRWTMR